MKRIGLMVLLSMLFVQQVFAVAPLNEDTIKKAQLYGMTQANVPIKEFFKPWTSFEEKAENLTDAESACVYTPFLLIASDARDKALDGEKVKISDSEKVIVDYCNVLSFKAQLTGKEANFFKNTRAFIKQDNQIMPVMHAVLPPSAEKKIGDPGFIMQGYFYFDEQKIDKEKPLILILLTNDNQEHRFYFDLKRVK